MELTDRIKYFLAETLIIKQKADDQTKTERLAVCEVCEHRDPENEKCRVCGCFLELKAGTAVNWNPKKNRNEITHCPEGRWNDKDTANEYRQIDGLKLLK